MPSGDKTGRVMVAEYSLLRNLQRPGRQFVTITDNRFWVVAHTFFRKSCYISSALLALGVWVLVNELIGKIHFDAITIRELHQNCTNRALSKPTESIHPSSANFVFQRTR